MKYFFYILLFSIPLFSQSGNAKDLIYFRAQSPEYIQQNNAFEVSVISRKEFAEATSLNFYLITDGGAYLTKADLQFVSKSTPLKFENALMPGVPGYVYKMRADLTDTSFNESDYFQMVFTLKSGESGKTSIDFKINFLNGSDILGSYSSLEDQDENISGLSIICYKPQPLAGEALALERSAKLEVSLKKNGNIKNLLAEFWGKFNRYDLRFLKVTDQSTQKELFELYKNPYKMLEVDNSASEAEIHTNSFIGRQSWNHYRIFFSIEKSSAEIYSNGERIYTVPLPGLTHLENLQFDFYNNTESARMWMDMLTFWRVDDSNVSFGGSNIYANSAPENSLLLAQFAFDDERTLREGYENEYAAAWIENAYYKKSDAPIFSRAPEINAAFIKGKFSISWKGNESNKAYMYVLERSLDGQNFHEIYSSIASSDGTRTYSYMDSPGGNSEIMFYRLKQVNADGSSAYSPQVKIGAAEIKEFEMLQNFPNPFNPKTKITIDILDDSYFELTIYDVVGKKIATLYKGQIQKGRHDFDFDGSKLPSGIYFYEAKTSDSSEIRKMILAK